MADSQEVTEFVSWFSAQHGVLDTDKMAVVTFPGHGRGVIALKDIPVCILLPSSKRVLDAEMCDRKAMQYSAYQEN